MNEAPRSTGERDEIRSLIASAARPLWLPWVAAALPVVFALYVLATAPEWKRALLDVFLIYGLGSAFFFALTHSLQAGVVRCRQGSFHRRRNPWSYWGYIGLMTVGCSLLLYAMILKALVIWKMDPG